MHQINYLFYLFTYLFIKNMCIDFRERGMERKSEKHQRERETSIGCLLHEPQTGNNLGLCPDHELNAQPFGVWDNAPNNWATLARADECILNY